MVELKSNKTKRFRLVFLIATTILFTGCYSHSFYLSNSHNVPVLKQKNESHVAIGVSEDLNVESLNIETAYSVTDNLAVMFNYMSHENEEYPKFGQIGKYYDFAIGYYKPFGRIGRINTPLIWDIYLGYGHQKQNHLFGNSDGIEGNADVSFHKPFIQTSIGLTSYAIDLIISSRIAYANYYSIKTDGNLKYDHETIEMIQNQRNFLFFEPAFTFRVGWKYIKIHTQISASYDSHPDILTPRINFSTGVVLKLTNRYVN